MGTSLLLACLWVVLATAIALMPQRFHWPGAVVLIALGVPLIGLITRDHGPVIGLIVLAGAASVLRWPLIRGGQWLLGRTRRRAPPAADPDPQGETNR